MPLAETQVLARVTTGTQPNPSPGLASERFHPLPHVVSARAGDATVLMDRKRGTYFTLNEVGSRVWELVGAGATVSEMVERLLDEYDVNQAKLEAHVATALQQLLGDRLIAVGPTFASMPALQPPASPTTRLANRGELKVPSVFWCGLLLAWFKGLLQIRAFWGTLEWIRRRIEPLRATAEADLETVKAVEYQVAMAGAFYPGRAKCLEQSLTLYYLLRRQGVAAVYYQGVQPYPFQAHAWIEYRGEVVNDVPEHARLFSRLSEQLP